MKNNKTITSIIMLISLVLLTSGCSKKMSIEDETVKKLYDMVDPYFISDLYPDFVSYKDSNFYMNKEVKYEDLTDESRLYYAYKTIDNVKRKTYSSCNELKGYTYRGEDVAEKCTSGKSELIAVTGSSEEWYFQDVNKATLEKAYKELYGSEKEMPKKDFGIFVTGMCLYSEENDEFLCFHETGSDTDLNHAETKIEKVTKNKDSIEIYDRYLWIEPGIEVNEIYYKSRFDEKEKIDSEEKDFTKGALYKHTFKKDKDDNYYWYSSERVK